uniref:Toxin_TOLIP domain-containing protein n=1 Tax=Panagrellus redivivus TaxID=6233 RepID=A0A7E4VT91_PANRE
MNFTKLYFTALLIICGALLADSIKCYVDQYRDIKEDCSYCTYSTRKPTLEVDCVGKHYVLQFDRKNVTVLNECYPEKSSWSGKVKICNTDLCNAKC